MQQKATIPIIVIAVVVVIGLVFIMGRKFLAPPPAGETPPPQWVQDIKKGNGAAGAGPPNTGGGSMGGRPGSMGGGSMGGSTGR